MKAKASRRPSSSIAEDEVAQFSRHAEDWWNPDGAFRPLHRLNPVRLAYIRDQVCAHFGREADTRHALKGLHALDVGCGGGILSEPLARLGAQVTGLDASKESIATAKRHAKAVGLNIDYRCMSIEELAEQLSPASFPRKRESRSASARHMTHTARGRGPLDSCLRGGDAKGGFDLITALEIAEHVADLESFTASLAKLLKPGGLLIMSTLNRTPKSFLLGIVAAEYILRWVPRGTHQWAKFLRPSELVRRLEESGLRTTDLTGLVFNPLRGEFELSATDLDVNYLLTAIKSTHRRG
jgi:2-polyprenyl-6-hydroxyphenyl methylase/3-demethylubiquinone-9 3-methyltransferase